MDVVGFCFLDLASNYEPPRVLMDWLKAGPKPIYIGFGSLVSVLSSTQIYGSFLRKQGFPIFWWLLKQLYLFIYFIPIV